jgi:hypothetical protein
METTKTCFKVITHGNNRGDVIAIMPDENLTYILFDERLMHLNKDVFKEAKSATVKEYSATKTKLERDFGLSIQVINRLR